MVPCHRERNIELSQLNGLLRPRRRMVDLRPALQPPLKPGAVLADIVEQPGKPRLFLPAEIRGKLGGQPGRPLKVLLHRLETGAVFRLMSQKRF